MRFRSLPQQSARRVLPEPVNDLRPVAVNTDHKRIAEERWTTDIHPTDDLLSPMMDTADDHDTPHTLHFFFLTLSVKPFLELEAGPGAKELCILFLGCSFA